MVPFFQKGTKIVPFFERGTVSEQKKVENSTPLKKGTVLVPLGALFFLNNHVYETVPLRHAPKGAILRTVK